MSVLVGDDVSLPRVGEDELVDRRSGVHALEAYLGSDGG